MPKDPIELAKLLKAVSDKGKEFKKEAAAATAAAKGLPDAQAAAKKAKGEWEGEEDEASE